MIGKMGWQPDGPDIRDLHAMSAKVLLISTTLEKYAPIPEPRPRKMDLLKWSPQIENQGLQDCTANAGIRIWELFNRKVGINYSQFSRRFLYKMTRVLMGLYGDTGATLRDTMKAMAKYGVPEEVFWPYDVAAYNATIPGDVFEEATKHQALVYYRLDPPGQPASRTVVQVKRFLAAELPSMLGFAVYSSIPQIGDGRCDIPFPQPGDKILGYHAVDIEGYDDDRQIGPDLGAYMIANSWSVNWGDQGYGWLPYRYILDGQACDIWSMVLAEKSKGAQAT